MQCPKCGAPNEDGRADCAVCGIVFSRFRATPERIPRNDPAPLVPAFSEHETRIPGWLVIAGIACLLAFGLFWTARRHAARARGEDMSTLHRRMNDINQSGNRQKAILERKSGFVRDSVSQPAAANHLALPSELTELRMQQLIGDCSEISNPVLVTIPKSFVASAYDNVLKQYPSLFPALRDGWVTLDPPLDSINSGSTSPSDNRTIFVKIPAAAYRTMIVTESALGYDINIGHRRIESISARQMLSDDRASCAFSWRYDQMVGASLGQDDVRNGGAEFARKGNFWTLKSVWLTKKGESETVCSY